MKPSIAAITLGVEDFQRSLKFYQDGLGWKRTGGDATGDIAFFKLNGVVLAIYPRHSLAVDATVDHSGSGFRGVTFSHNVPSEADVDAAVAKAEAAGATIVKRPEKAFWGGYSGYIADPDGHLWEVAYNPYWGLTDDGTAILPD